MIDVTFPNECCSSSDQCACISEPARSELISASEMLAADIEDLYECEVEAPGLHYRITELIFSELRKQRKWLPQEVVDALPSASSDRFTDGSA